MIKYLKIVQYIKDNGIYSVETEHVADLYKVKHECWELGLDRGYKVIFRRSSGFRTQLELSMYSKDDEIVVHDIGMDKLERRANECSSIYELIDNYIDESKQRRDEKVRELEEVKRFFRP